MLLFTEHFFCVFCHRQKTYKIEMINTELVFLFPGGNNNRPRCIERNTEFFGTDLQGIRNGALNKVSCDNERQKYPTSPLKKKGNARLTLWSREAYTCSSQLKVHSTYLLSKGRSGTLSEAWFSIHLINISGWFLPRLWGSVRQQSPVHPLGLVQEEGEAEKPEEGVLPQEQQGRVRPQW